MDAYDALILEASLRANAGSGALQLPWEQGVLGEICGANCGWLSKLPCDVNIPQPPPVPAAQSSSAGVKRKRIPVPEGVPLYVHSILSVDEKSHAEQKELDWTRGLAIWLGLHRGSQLQLSLIHISEPTRLESKSRVPASA